MKHVMKPAERPAKGLSWQVLRLPATCLHRFEVIAHEVGAALQRRAQCGGLEAE